MKPIMTSCLCLVLAAAACESVDPKPVRTYSPAPDAISEASRNVTTSREQKAGGAAIDQIETTMDDEIGQLIVELDAGQITINQLRAYKDLCDTSDGGEVPEGIDCSEMRLVMERAFKDETELEKALLLLDSLSRNDGKNPNARLAEDFSGGTNFNYSPELLMGTPTEPAAPPDTGTQDLPPGAESTIQAIIQTQ